VVRAIKQKATHPTMPTDLPPAGQVHLCSSNHLS
jgi:hypothetical protein